MPLPSLRSRIVIGTFLWTIGLYAGVMIHMVYWWPNFVRHVHLALAHFVLIMGITIAAMIGGFWQIRKGLSTVEQLRTRLSSVHRGEAQRVDGTYPNEIQPLVDDLNALLEDRERSVQRAIAKAGDLAHGLKTPLAVLSQEAERASRSGHADVAESVGYQVDRMRKHIDYHLAHARAAASGAKPGTHSSVRPSVDALVRTLMQLHTERGLTIDVHVGPEHAVRCQREDLEEMLGNLLDNACKWARGRVVLASSQNGSGMTTITIDDDGPGLPPAMRESVLQRGVRADEAVPGSGLGLAIVRDLAELYGGSIELAESVSGGLSARLRLPSLALDHEPRRH
jgi:signal transduction histidine kinase